MNQVVLVGNITRELEVKKTTTSKSVLEFSIAVNEGYGDKKRTDFINCIAWEGRAETIAQYFDKGSKILITGRLRNEKYEKDGQTRYKSYVLVDGFEFMQSNSVRSNEYESPVEESIDDIPSYDEQVTYEQESLPFY